MKKETWIDGASILTLVVTLVLFLVALVETGLTHDLSLEAGVFLVSIKLVLAAHKNELLIAKLEQKIDRLQESLDREDPKFPL